ncbi:unnamed protein product [Lampetra fluviatilis]
MYAANPRSSEMRGGETWEETAQGENVRSRPCDPSLSRHGWWKRLHSERALWRPLLPPRGFSIKSAQSDNAGHTNSGKRQEQPTLHPAVVSTEPGWALPLR